jgi:hypothetical protein
MATRIKLKAKNWQNYQHYKDRKAPWVKLPRSLLDDYDFNALPIASKALAPMLLLLATEHLDGLIDGNVEQISFRLRMTSEQFLEGLIPLLEQGFFIDSSSVQS